ncbi:hypothetical protein BN938_2673 [Mucinivorans hirudinis]|uniref:Uncharacterized protein n=1 Tax=Mucinivorans hirudinis TaxID=1433126 RepID=A0A060RAW5_9BACT|nr:hypothetical protein BN938_2673 [Mucinivorans hirudinis]
MPGQFVIVGNGRSPLTLMLLSLRYKQHLVKTFSFLLLF